MARDRNIWITKASGKKELFSKKKIERTCVRAGASSELANKIASKVARQVYQGMRTRDILKLTLSLLKAHPHIAERYNLKRAIMLLGPKGFIFEKYIAAILRNYGYFTQTDKKYPGKRVKQEVDIIAKKNKKTYMIECKYHNAPGIHTHLKVAMYTYARFLDIKKFFNQPWLVSNTKLTPAAIKYSQGVNLKITTWNYPAKENLRMLIEKKKLYPITILSSLGRFARERLAQANIVLVKDLLENDFKKIQARTAIPENILRKLINEAQKHM